MQIEELVGFLDWVDVEIKKSNIVELYQQLQTNLSKNSQPNQAKVSFETQKTNLINGILEVDLDALNNAQSSFAEKIGLLDLVGQKGKDFIEDTLYKNVIDVNTSAQKIKTSINSLNKIIEKLDQVKQGLSDYVIAVPYEYEEALLHIRFQNDVSIKNIVDLKKWGNAWFDIGRGVALANDLAPEDVKVIGTSRGSIIVDLGVTFLIAKTLSNIVLLVLNVADKVLEIRKKAQEIRALKLSNDKAATELEKEAENVQKDGQASVLAAIKKETKLNGEQDTALTNAINKIFEFISGGGVVDINIKNTTSVDGVDNKKIITEIKASFKEIKRLEGNILMLKPKN